MHIVTSAELDSFVAESDARGGPGHPDCEAWWRKIEVRPDIRVDQSLDPFSEAYVAEQLALYGDLSGRSFDQQVNERTTFDVDRHVAAPNPYDHGSPGGLAQHVERLSRAIRLAAPPRPGRMLDMGCGWGLSSEIAAYSGLDVTAVDVSAEFIDLVSRRAAHSGLPIRTVRSEFDAFETDEQFDLVLFYECFHHALRPWSLARRIAHFLRTGGKLVLAFEPINDIWWRHWGLRLDPLSVYCIRKHGWLESGWSMPFLQRLLRRAGLAPWAVPPSEDGHGWTIVAEKMACGPVSPTTIAHGWEPEGWSVEPDHLVCAGQSGLLPVFPDDARAIALDLRNYRPRPIDVAIGWAGSRPIYRTLKPGATRLELPRPAADTVLKLAGDRWVPAKEVGNDDRRKISFHLAGAEFIA